MSLLKVIFDPTLTQSEIVVPLQNSSQDEAEEVYTKNQPEIQQTSMYGIQSPLIMINKIVVDFSDVVDFELLCTGTMPSVKMTVRDRKNLTTMFDTPGIDNELRVQVLPKFENVYKKINLTFYITSMSSQDEFISIVGEYKSPKFISANIKSFGEVDTYTLFEKIAQETELGFVSNITAGDLDKRWVYCDNKSYSELLNTEIERSGSDLQICDYWIDWWNNIVLADIYERYNTKDKDEDMQIWIAGRQDVAAEGVETKPQKVIATLHNHPSQELSELHVENMEVLNEAGSQMYSGTDRVFSTYENSKSEYLDYLIQDGDTKKDIFTKYEYLGEVYGEFNYLLQGKKRETFLQKIRTNETIKIMLKTPLFGVMRGNHVNLMWYYNDDATENLKTKLVEDGAAEEATSDIDTSETDEEEDNKGSGQFIMDKTKSGQYLVTGCRMGYIDEEGWNYELTLSRPSINKQSILKDE